MPDSVEEDFLHRQDLIAVIKIYSPWLSTTECEKILSIIDRDFGAIRNKIQESLDETPKEVNLKESLAQIARFNRESAWNWSTPVDESKIVNESKR